MNLTALNVAQGGDTVFYAVSRKISLIENCSCLTACGCPAKAYYAGFRKIRRFFALRFSASLAFVSAS